MEKDKLVSLFLRLGLAFVFLYAAGASFFDPNSWSGFFPQFLQNIFPRALLLAGFSIFEIVLGLWLLSGWRIFYAAVFAVLALLGIIIPNLGAFDIIFRDVAILTSAVALAVLHRRP